jgi:hypothetical protein
LRSRGEAANAGAGVGMGVEELTCSSRPTSCTETVYNGRPPARIAMRAHAGTAGR